MNNIQFKELVKKGIDGVMNQGCLCVDGSYCLYINSDGHYCVVGHLMPSDIVREQADSVNSSGDIPIVGLYKRYLSSGLGSLPELKQFISQFTNSQIEVLSQLQSGHDFKHETPLDLTYFYDKSMEIYNKL